MTSDTPDPAAPEPAAPANDTHVDPATRIAELETLVLQLKDQALRALAEAENTRRRTQREIEDNNKYAASNFARDILPVADNLRRAIEAIPAESRMADSALVQFATGVELTERELLAALERHHIKRVDPQGQPFDHNLHQAVMQVDAPGTPAGIVVQVLQPGYTLNGRLLRAAMVAVATGAGAKIDTTA